MQLFTKRGYNLLDVASALQKSIRRGDEKLAGYMAHELVSSNYHNYVWKRLLTISAEDVDGIVTKEIYALHQSFIFINKNEKKKLKGRIFISKAVLILSRAVKSRDPDHLQCLMYDHKLGITDEEIEAEIQAQIESERLEIPQYTYDCHTVRGKKSGMTKTEFFIDEHAALVPKPEQKSIFDEIAETHEYPRKK